jgi:O-antigen ligase
MRDADHIASTSNRWAFLFLCAAACCAMFSLPLSRAMLVLSLVALIVDCVRYRRSVRFPLVAWAWLAFVAVAVLASAVGLNPSRSFQKLDKLVWYVGIPLAATLVRDDARVRAVFSALCIGAGVLAAEILVWRPFAAWRAFRAAVADGEPGDYLWELTDLGSMTDGQTLMLAVVAMAGLFLLSRPRRLESLGLVAFVAALVVNLKRGSWICAVAVMGVFVAMRLRRRYQVALVLATIGVLLLPPLWGRLSDLRHEFDASRGGRMVMWTRVAPPLVKAHPFGIGYRALTSDLMQAVGREQGVFVEPGRNHLHSNPIQILVALGWGGLVVYLFWMGCALFSGIRRAVRSPADSQPRVLGLCMLLMLMGLILNGLVEYNFADGELVILYGILLGMIAGPNASFTET